MVGTEWVGIKSKMKSFGIQFSNLAYNTTAGNYLHVIKFKHIYLLLSFAKLHVMICHCVTLPLA